MSSVFKNMSPEELQELLSNFIISSWSYSKVSAFARNEAAFEMNYIYGVKGRRSATTIAGEAYHEALNYYFTERKAGRIIDIVELEKSAFLYIDEVPGNTWKLQKTTPTIEEAIKNASDTAVTLLRSFVKEIGVYMDEIEEILSSEEKLEEWLTISGVDIPLPCHGKIDLRVRLKDGRRVIIDHKSKKTYTPDEEIALKIGVQAITYVKLAEAKHGEPIDEVWFMENKHAANKDKSPQIQAFKVEITPDTRALYEVLLYEPVRRVIDAVSDPEYVYLINNDDNFTDMAELYDHKCRTMIAEIGVEDFNVEEAKKDLVSKRLKKIRDSSITVVTPQVIKNFKANASSFIQYNLSSTNMTPNERIEHVLRTFGSAVEVAHQMTGYSSDTYLLAIGAGVSVAGIKKRRLDLANALNVEDVRISDRMTVYQDRSYIGLEVAKKRTRDLLWTPKDLVDERIPIGRDNFGNIIVWDWRNQSTPHALVCGSTGSGKSVCMKSTIEYGFQANTQRAIILDPKFEFLEYKQRRNCEVINEFDEIAARLYALVEEMNTSVKAGHSERVMIVFDEFADALAQGDGTIEENLRILLQKSRSVGYRIMAGTQRADTKVMTGNLKVNLPVQICFRVNKRVDSMVVLDETGAETLAGHGDGLIKSPEYRDTVRFQAYYKPQ